MAYKWGEKGKKTKPAPKAPAKKKAAPSKKRSSYKWGDKKK